MRILSSVLACLFVSLTIASPLHHVKRQSSACCSNSTTIRVDFNSMPPAERQSYTNAIRCMMDLPSELDQTTYPAATSRYFDYAVIHVLRSQQIHNSGFFLTWHRYFLSLLERDLRTLCSYTGRFPYWNFAATSTLDTLASSPIFDGSPSSLSGDGLPTNLSTPIVLGPTLTLPHGTGGGCVTTGPFANLTVPLAFIPPSYLINGTLPATAFALQPNCLTRDLNSFVASTYTSESNITTAVTAPDAAAFELALNGVLGGGSLGVHSGAHFQVGGAAGQMSSIHVSVQDPVWFAMHAFVDLVWDSWQKAHPGLGADEQVSGTETAGNVPPSDVVTGDSVLPDWGYLEEGEWRVRDLVSTTEGPFCYVYDVVVG